MKIFSHHPLRTTFLIVLVLSSLLLLLTACALFTPSAEVESTPSETPEMATATSTRAPTKTPTATEAPPTETPPTPTQETPTETVTPEVTRTPLPTMTASPTAPGSLATPTVIVWQPDLSIPEPPDVVYYYDCEIEAQEPPGYTEFAPGTEFDLFWEVRNVGLAQWEKDHYYFRYIDGARLEKYDDKYEFDQLVGPTQEINFRVDFVAPNDPGLYETHWGIVNVDTNEVACHLYLSIRVIK